MHLTAGCQPVHKGICLGSKRNSNGEGRRFRFSRRLAAALLVAAVLLPLGGSLSASRLYTVKWGDSLWGISRKFGVAVKDIASANKIRDPRWILVGQKIIIPGKYPGKQIVQQAKVTKVAVDPAKGIPGFLRAWRLLDPRAQVALANPAPAPVKPRFMFFQQPSEPQPERKGTLEMLVGESRMLVVNQMVRTAIGDPAIADVAAITPNELLVNGKAQGRTTLFVWEKDRFSSYNVTVLKDTSILRAQIDSEIGSDTIRVKVVNDSAILEGTAATQKEADRAEAIAKAHAKSVTNLITVTANDPSTQRAAREDEIRKLLADDGIKVKVVNDTVMLEGKASKQRADRAAKLVSAYMGEIQPEPKANGASGASGAGAQNSQTTTKVIDLIDRTPLQVQVKAKVVEINRIALKDLGIEYGALTRDTKGSAPDNPPSPQPSIFSPEQFVFGQINRGDGIEGLDLLGIRLRALIQKNQAKILSEPNVVVADGNKANILVGGEIPIPVSQSVNGGVASISVEFKEFGIKLEIEPTVGDDGQILMHVRPEVSTLDFENGVVFSGLRIPALRTRRADSVVNIHDKDTLIIGGLVSSSITKTVKKLPLLGDLPILGALFRSTQFQRDESDLVIFISPEIIMPKEAAK